ncbi:MAG: hypothetical protein ACE5G0_17455, partial [Rhodothermales bacterium]
MKRFTQILIVWSLLLTPLYAQTVEWEQTNGPLGGDITALVTTDTGTLIAGTWVGGLYRSTDGGQTWTPLEESFQRFFLFNSVWDLDKNSQGHLFAATARGVLRSTDNGDTWTLFVAGLTDRFIRALAINSNDIIFAGSAREGIFRSDDNGENWTAINNGLTVLDVQSVAINSLGDVYAGTTDGIFKSSENGDNWAEVSSGLENKNIKALFVTPEDSLLVGTFNGAYRSADHGANWIKLTGPFGSNWSFARNASGVLFAGSGGFFFRSSDNGLTWSQTLAEKIEFATFADLYVTPAQELISATYNHGVMKSSDHGDTWQQQNAGLTAVDIVDMTQTPGGTIFVGGNDGIYRTNDGGENWSRALIPGTLFIASNDTGRLFASLNGLLRISDDNGDSWFDADSSFSAARLFPESIAFGSDSVIYVGVYGQIFKSTDGGDTWSELTTPIPNTTVQA